MVSKTNKNSLAEDWIIAISISEEKGANLMLFHGTKEEVVEHLLSIIHRDKNSDEDIWERGSLDVDTLAFRPVAYTVYPSSSRVKMNEEWKEVYGFNEFCGYRIDYTALRLSDLKRA